MFIVTITLCYRHPPQLGQAQIDWVTLTYFLWERVVQDLMEYARNVWFRDDWGEEATGEAARLFQEILEGRSSTINAAYQALAHLPTVLTVPPGRALDERVD